MSAKSNAASKGSRTKNTKTDNAPSKVDARNSASLSREITGLCLLAISLGIVLSIASFEPNDLISDAPPQNWIGPVGVWVGDALLSIFGVGAFFLNLMLAHLGFSLLIGRVVDSKSTEVTGYLLFVISSTILGHLIVYDQLLFGHVPGGMIGELCGELLRSLFGTAGAYIIGTSALLLALMLSADMSLGALLRVVVGQFHKIGAYIRHRRAVRREFKQRYELERQKLLGDTATIDKIARDAREEAELALTPLTPDGYEFEENFDDEVERKLSSKLGKLMRRSRNSDETVSSSEKTPSKRAKKKDKITSQAADEGQDDAENLFDEPWELGDEPSLTNDDPDITPVVNAAQDSIDDVSSPTTRMDISDEKESTPLVRGIDADFGPQIVESDAKRRAKERQDLLSSSDDGILFKPTKKGSYELPPLSYLNFDRTDEIQIDTDQLKSMAAQIEQTLKDFKVDGNVVEICPGPVITMFEFSPAPGVKVSKIAGLADDLAMALAAISVRIIAPLPGKGVVGIEVPNPDREMVFLKEIIADDTFQDTKKMHLPLALGKDTEGGTVVADLAKMPHLLVAGATGAGKSVAVNTMICSLLYKHTPDDVRLIMVDPKMLEFSIYADIPHLLLPVVTDPKQATVALNWAVQEMERRYQNLADMKVRDIRSYNQKVEVLTKQAELDQLEGKDESPALKALGISANGDPQHKRLPYIIVIIDEFADLMMTASKDVETAVARIAQKARAAGIHLILATQRPSTDVITGLIKANFPTRLALRVSGKVDSRVILDANGAEGLLGNGDMLFVPPGEATLKRTHGAYVSEKEISQIVDFLKAQGNPLYDESILVEDNEEDGAVSDEDKDEYYEQAVRLVIQSKQASVSMLQRKLRVGYNRAARMVEIMELEGIVGPSDSCKPRDVLVEESPY